LRDRDTNRVVARTHFEERKKETERIKNSSTHHDHRLAERFEKEKKETKTKEKKKTALLILFAETRRARSTRPKDKERERSRDLAVLSTRANVSPER